METVKNVTLFIAAPFIGLVYAACMPFVGLGMMAYLVLKPSKQAQKNTEMQTASVN